MNNEIWIYRNCGRLNNAMGMNCSEEITQLFQLTYGTLLPIIIIVGILGNIVNLIVLSSPLLQTISYTLAKSRAVSDILTMLSFIPLLFQIKKTGSVWNNYFIAFYYAKLQQLILYTSVCINSLYVTAFTIERYLFLCNPLETHLDCNHRKKTLIAVIAIPLLTILLHVPHCFIANIIVYNCSVPTKSLQYSSRENKEIMNAPSYVLYSLVVHLLFRILPPLIVILLNTNVIIEYRKSSRNRLQQTGCDSAAQQRRDKKMIMSMILGTSVTFVVNTTNIAFLLSSNDKWRCEYGFQLFGAVSNMLVVSYFSLPVVMYLTFSTGYKNAASSLIFKLVKVSPRTTE